MAIKKKKRSREERAGKHARANWTHDDEVELSAWLDYVLSTSTTAGPQISSFVTHFQNCRHKTFTVAQIQHKIKSLWLANGNPSASSPDEMYVRGTKCLPRLPTNFKKEVVERLGTLKDEMLAKRLESPRQLRSASRSADTELSRHISLGVDIAEMPSARKRHREKPIRNAGSGGWKLRKGRDALEQLMPDVDDCSRQEQFKEEDEAETPVPPFRLRVVQDSEDERTSNGSRSSPTIRLFQERRRSPSTVDFSQTAQAEQMEYAAESESVGDHQSTDFGDEERELLLFRGPDQELEVQREYIEMIHSLRRKLSTVEKDREELRRQLDSRDHTNWAFSQAHQPVLKRLADNDEEISCLREALGNKERLRCFSTLSSDDHMPIELEKMSDEMASIGDKLKRMLGEYEDHGFRMTASFDEQHQLHSLFCRSFALDLSDPLTSVSQALDWSDVTLSAILRTLIASALCEWVFERDLPAVSETPCALLEKYRLHLGLQDGEIALRNLDFAAHTSLIEEDFFQQHVIPARASVLADRIIRTLAPFFPLPDDVEDIEDAQVISTWSAKRVPLAEVVESALRIKAYVTLSTDLFEMVLYSPSTSFDQEVMMPEAMDGGPAKTPRYSTPKVKLCLLPSLHIYNHDRKMVDLNNFVRRPTTQRSEAFQLTKAIVVLDDA